MSQGKTTIPGLDDGEELQVTDVRNRMQALNVILILSAFIKFPLFLIASLFIPLIPKPYLLNFINFKLFLMVLDNIKTVLPNFQI